ncbi:hemolysin, partial [Fusobacterium animalis ATCC 51191]
SSFDIAKMDKDSEVTSDKYGEQVEGFENIAGGALKLSSITSEVNDNPEMLDKDPETRKRLYQAGKEFNETYNKNIDYMVTGWHRPEVAKEEALILEREIPKEKNPEVKNLLIARHGYLEREAHPLGSMGKSLFKGGVKGFVTTITIRLASKTAVGKATTLTVIGGKMVLDGINGAKEIEKIPISSKQANKMKRIAPEFYKSAEDIFKIEEKTDTSDTSLLGMAEDYYRNSQTPDERLANDVGYVAGGYAASKGMDIAESKYNSLKTLTSDPNLVSANEVTNGEQLLLENKVNSVQGKVFINDGTPGGTTIAHQIRTTYSSGNMSILQNNLTTGELSLQGINSSGQLIYEKSLTPYPANALIGTSSSSQMLVGDG